jgi:hypothetical protein
MYFRIQLGQMFDLEVGRYLYLRVGRLDWFLGPRSRAFNGSERH